MIESIRWILSSIAWLWRSRFDLKLKVEGAINGLNDVRVKILVLQIVLPES